jgi:hypothetical protein
MPERKTTLTSAMSHTVSTPPALFRGGKASADSLKANREVERISGRATEARDERDLSFVVGNAGFLPREEKGNRMGVIPRGLAHNADYISRAGTAVYTAVKKSRCCSHEQQLKRYRIQEVVLFRSTQL